VTALPAKTSISNVYPNPKNSVARAGFAQLWDAINETIEKPELDVASATTCDIGGQLSTKLRITGTTTIASFGTNYRGPIQIRMAEALTITHNSITLACPGGASIATAAGDVLVAWPKATSGTVDGWQVVRLARGSLRADVAAHATSANIWTANFAWLTGSATTITDFADAPQAGSKVEVYCDAAHTFVNNSNLLIQGGANLTVSAGDRLRVRASTASIFIVEYIPRLPFAIGQTWQNMLASRAVSTTYTNSTGRPILVSVGGNISVAGAAMNFSIDGVNVAYSGMTYTSSAFVMVNSVLVPNGSTYSVAPGSGTLTLTIWRELR